MLIIISSSGNSQISTDSTASQSCQILLICWNIWETSEYVKVVCFLFISEGTGPGTNMGLVPSHIFPINLHDFTFSFSVRGSEERGMTTPGLKQKLLPTMSIADTLGDDHWSFRNLAHGYDEKRSNSQFFQFVCNHLRWFQCLRFCAFTRQQYLEKLGPDHLRPSWYCDNLVVLIIFMMRGLGGMRTR